MADKPEALAHIEVALDNGEIPMLAKRVARNQLVIAQHTLDAFPGIEDYKVVIEGGKIVLTPVKLPPWMTCTATLPA